MKIEIKASFDGRVLFTHDAAENSLRITLEAAVKANADLGGANLGGADLGGANLGGANLRNADLGGANLRNADLADANLGGADLGGANLGDAYLAGANLGGANLGGANLGGANLRNANFGGADLANANLGDAYLGGANLGGANLGGANLGGANLRNANLGGADLGGADLVSALKSEPAERPDLAQELWDMALAMNRVAAEELQVRDPRKDEWERPVWLTPCCNEEAVYNGQLSSGVHIYRCPNDGCHKDGYIMGQLIQAQPSDLEIPAPNAAEREAAAALSHKAPADMTRDDWDDLYDDCESNGEGDPRSMVRYAYEYGWKAARKARKASQCSDPDFDELVRRSRAHDDLLGALNAFMNAITALDIRYAQSRARAAIARAEAP